MVLISVDLESLVGFLLILGADVFHLYITKGFSHSVCHLYAHFLSRHSSLLSPLVYSQIESNLRTDSKSFSKFCSLEIEAKGVASLFIYRSLIQVLEVGK